MSETERRAGALGWRKASFSVSNGACTEVAVVPGTIMVRDSTNPDGTQLRLAAGAWREFIERIKGA